MCVVTLDDCENLRSHTWHLNGFSPAHTRETQLLKRLYDLSGSPPVRSVSGEMSSRTGVGRIPEWMRRWALRLAACEKVFLQTEHCVAQREQVKIGIYVFYNVHCTLHCSVILMSESLVSSGQ